MPTQLTLCPVLRHATPHSTMTTTGRAPLFKLMEEDYERRAAEQQEAKQQFYVEAVGAYKMARVSQLVSGEVLVRPPPGPAPGEEGSWRSPSPAGVHRRGGGQARVRSAADLACCVQECPCLNWLGVSWQEERP